tara:strand:- start:3209 stop:3850 length:642 start_codon:yes stop_codon:yes gene_type:complete
MNHKKHVIFDWNGTLVDDAWIFVDILNALLIPRGLKKITLYDYRDAFCFPIKSFYSQLGVDVSKKSFQDLEKEFVFEYNRRMYKPKLFKEVNGVLKKLISRGFGLSILSASNEKTLVKLIKYYSLNQYFEYVVGVNNYGAKGKRENGKKLIHQLGVNNKEILMIGDTDYDYEVATYLNIDCLLKINGHQSDQRLKLKTKNIITSLNDIARDYQ